MTHRIVFFDFETAGLEPEHASIQLAAVATEGLVEVDAFEAKIQFDEGAADPDALAKNHYDARVWRDQAKPEPVVARAFRNFLDKHATIEKTSKRTGNVYHLAWLAGHNIVSFDIPRLVALFRHVPFLAGDTFRPLDTLHLAHWHASVTGARDGSFGLTECCERFGIDVTGAHDALADVRLCVKLARRLQQDIAALQLPPA
jgi:DNA polymerase III epsilon subunit-like protein